MNLPAVKINLWDDFIEEIKCSIPRQSFLTWFGPMRLINIDNGELTVQVPSQFYYDWIEEHYSDYINGALNKTFGNGFKLSYSILEKDTREFLKLGPARSPYVAGQSPPRDSHLNSRYTFDNFIEGDCNSFAKAAALAVAEAPGKTRFNPLVIIGGVGLGKTHLIQAIGNFAVQNKTSRRTIYASSEKFTLDFITSIRENRTTTFSNLYRSADILLVDDVQFLEGKERTQMEFFHTFNTLYNAGKQVVLTMDCPPSELTRTEARLISRYQCGLVADIQPPDLETRIAILQKRADDDNLSFDKDVLEAIAVNVTNNVRELEGALIRLMAHASITGQDIDLFQTKKLLKDVLKNKLLKVSVEQIQNTVSDWANIPSDLIRGNSRKKEIARARQIAMYLCNELTELTLKSIGSHFGNRDHSTVIHAVNVSEKMLSKNDDLRREVMEMKQKLETSF